VPTLLWWLFLVVRSSLSAPPAASVTLDCGHIPQIERPAELHRVIRSFLTG
jgi:pimeloyl-ACP methyl ester carboxylesterase